ncbi:MAG: serine O-acetyltransferase [Candidatus Sericytochromatia bacterium]|nr:serine O-acetyltransferase [Candidatus Tanganyikabacteria bacterium]
MVEVILSYPSLHAVFWHRVSHALWKARVPLIPRLLSQLVRWFTLIEIHPGARIGRRLFIDHGAAVVIGETSEIGDDVLLYHQVTLGGTSTRKEKRHPTLCDNVIVGAGAAVLGAITVGEGARIGAGSVVLRDVPPHATVVGVPGRVMMIEGKPVAPPESESFMPDPEAQAIKALADRVAALESEIKAHHPGRPDRAEIPQPVEDFLHGAGI